MNKETIRQSQEENDSWKRVLGFLQTENNYLKIRLAHLVTQEISPKFLARAETLQNELIQKDELIALNRSSLSGFDKCLNRQGHENDHIIKDVGKNIRGQIEQLEQKFSRHRSEFNDHLSEYL
jgi:hypothetical protein